MVLFSGIWIMSSSVNAQQSTSGLTSVRATNAAANINTGRQLFLDVHHFGPGNVTFDDVAKAHAKDLATEGQYGVEFTKFWVDAASGTVYCLVSAFDTASIIKTHAKAHGLLPDHIYTVTGGRDVTARGVENLYLDLHDFGAGNVKASDVAVAHQKDLAVQKKYGVNFINYWVDEKEGTIMCLSEARDSTSVIETHKEAHGLLPAHIMKVKQGQ